MNRAPDGSLAAAHEMQMANLERTVGRIEGKLDTFITQMAVQDNRATALEARMRKVEARQHWYSGAGALAGMFLGALGINIHGVRL